jgi:hypothetical protein
MDIAREAKLEQIPGRQAGRQLLPSILLLLKSLEWRDPWRRRGRRRLSCVVACRSLERAMRPIYREMQRWVRGRDCVARAHRWVDRSLHTLSCHAALSVWVRVGSVGTVGWTGVVVTRWIHILSLP